ncbi:MAG: iron-containing alcohol dehydrogenase [Actinoallomurus sp.]
MLAAALKSYLGGPATRPSSRPVNRSRLRKFLVPEVVFGVGTLGEVGSAVRRLGGTRPFVISDAGVMAAGWVEAALPSFEEAGLNCQVWHGITPNPKDHEVAAGFECYLESGCDVVVAIGGGSCIDAAKAVAILSGNGGNILEYSGIERVSRPVPPLVAMPSTAGTGADVSQFCVITDTIRKRKATIASRGVMPNISVTDPRLLTTMSTELTVYTGFDALSHAIEAYVSKGGNFLSDLHALAAVEAVRDHLLNSIERPDDLMAREGMAQASLQAGLAFSNAFLGATHAISHQVGGALDLSHGLLNAMLLPYVMSFNAETRPERYVEIAEVLGVAAPGMRPAEAAAAAIDWVRSFADKLSIPRRLGSLGVTVEDIDRFARNALDDAYILTNPRTVTVGDVKRICLAVL